MPLQRTHGVVLQQILLSPQQQEPHAHTASRADDARRNRWPGKIGIGDRDIATPEWRRDTPRSMSRRWLTLSRKATTRDDRQRVRRPVETLPSWRAQSLQSMLVQPRHNSIIAVWIRASSRPPGRTHRVVKARMARLGHVESSMMLIPPTEGNAAVNRGRACGAIDAQRSAQSDASQCRAKHVPRRQQRANAGRYRRATTPSQSRRYARRTATPRCAARPVHRRCDPVSSSAKM